MSFLDAISQTAQNIAIGFDRGVNTVGQYSQFLAYEKQKLGFPNYVTVPGAAAYPSSYYTPIYPAQVPASTVYPPQTYYDTPAQQSGTDILPLVALGLALYLLMKA